MRPGTASLTTVPEPGALVSVRFAPMRSARSLMPRSPKWPTLPFDATSASRPTPSSAIVIVRSRARASVTSIRVAAEWAQAFRVKPREDVFVVDRTATAPLDPYTDDGYSSSVGIDATRPFGGEFPEVSEVPGWRDFDLPEINRS